MNIIYEDNHQLVLNKPAGMLTQPASGHDTSLEELAKQYIKEKYHKPGSVYLHAVHRLDKPVSGIILFARTSKALSRLQAAMRSKQCQKTYLALVEGHMEYPEGTLEHTLTHDEHRAVSDHKGKLSILHYRVIKDSLLEIILETGRYHQIRAQLSLIGHPIIGDSKYGSTKAFHEGGIALHHYRLKVPHPITNEIQTFEADPPQGFGDFFHHRGTETERKG